jgi:hypothetical protein
VKTGCFATFSSISASPAGPPRRLDVLTLGRESAGPRAARPGTAAEHAAEELIQIDILETLLPGTALAEGIAAGTAARTTAEAAELLAPVRVDLAPIKFRPLLCVAQQVEGGGNPLEPLVGDRIAGVLVGMQFLGELAERLLDFVRARAPRNAQFLVGIARHVECRSISLESVS